MACSISIRRGEGDSPALRQFRFKGGCNVPGQLKHRGSLRIRKVGKRGNMAAGNDQRMTLVDGSDVQKCDRQFVLPDVGGAGFL